jgi:hypothetical protein
MHRCGLSRWLFMTLAPAVVFALPLSLAGCGGSDSSQPQVVAPKDFNETHKDSMNEFMKNKEQKGGKK